MQYVEHYKSLVEIEDDSRWWDIYLKTNMEKSFDSWKKEKLKNQYQSGLMNQTEKENIDASIAAQKKKLKENKK